MYTKSVDVYTVDDFNENGKVAYESWGAHYITNDAEEIKILRDYIKTRVDNMFTEVKE